MGSFKTKGNCYVLLICTLLLAGSQAGNNLSISSTLGFRPPSATVVSAEPFSYGTGTLRCLQKEMATYRHWSVSLWQDPDDVSHCRILSPDKTEWWLISATLCGWRRCFVADQLWLMTRIREEEVLYLYLSPSDESWIHSYVDPASLKTESTESLRYLLVWL